MLTHDARWRIQDTTVGGAMLRTPDGARFAIPCHGNVNLSASMFSRDATSWCNVINYDYQRKFRSSNFRLYWKLPVALAASMFDSRDVLAGRNCAKCCVFSVVSWLRRLAKVGPKSEVVRRIGCPRCRQNLHHACARERFGSQNR